MSASKYLHLAERAAYLTTAVGDPLMTICGTEFEKVARADMTLPRCPVCFGSLEREGGQVFLTDDTSYVVRGWQQPGWWYTTTNTTGTPGATFTWRGGAA